MNLRSIVVALFAISALACAGCATSEAVEPSAESAPNAEASAESDDTHEQVAQSDEPTSEPTSQPTSQPSDDHADHDHGAHGGGGGTMQYVLDEGEYDPAEVVAQPGAQIGDITQCPVSGEVFTLTEDHAFFEHEGENVYFCCPSCIRTFQRDPEGHLIDG